jgi:hypothetical protein
MKLSIAFIFLIYLTQASNICFLQPNITCNEISACDPNCQSLLQRLLLEFQTLSDVFNLVHYNLGGLWTVVQTQNANWYSNWGRAAICNCGQFETIFVQQ